MENTTTKKGGFQSGFYLIIGAVILGLAFLAARQFGIWDKVTALVTSDTNTASVNKTESNDSVTTASPVMATGGTDSKVNITPPAEPQNPTRRGVAMLGPSGLFLYVTDTDGNTVKLVQKKLQKELVQENFVDPEAIVNGLKGYIDDMRNAGVKGNGNIQFITASSTANNPQVQKILTQLKRMGVIVTMTTSDNEGKWAFQSAVAQQYRDKSFLVDVTPSITRITWAVNGSYTTVVANVGSKSDNSEGAATAEINKVISRIPQSSKQNCFVIWAASENILRQGAPAYSSEPSYSGNDVSIVAGLNIVKAAKDSSNAQVIYVWEAAYPMGFLGVK